MCRAPNRAASPVLRHPLPSRRYRRLLLLESPVSRPLMVTEAKRSTWRRGRSRARESEVTGRPGDGVARPQLAGRNPVQVVLLRLAWPTHAALRAHLAQPQLSPAAGLSAW